MMERGEFTSTKVRNTKTVKASMAIFATSNSTFTPLLTTIILSKAQKRKALDVYGEKRVV